MDSIVRRIFAHLKTLDPNGEEARLHSPNGEASFNEVKMQLQPSDLSLPEESTPDTPQELQTVPEASPTPVDQSGELVKMCLSEN